MSANLANTTSAITGIVGAGLVAGVAVKSLDFVDKSMSRTQRQQKRTNKKTTKKSKKSKSRKPKLKVFEPYRFSFK